MAFDRITDGDLLGKGNLGRPDTPGVDTAEMQRILDELPREVIVPAFNRLAGQLEAGSAAAGLGAAVPQGLPEGTPATVQGVMEAVLGKGDGHAARADNPHGVTAAQTGAYTKEETDAAIGQRVVEIGTGDMARAVYDPTGQQRDVFAAIREAVENAGHMEKRAYAAKGEAGAVDRALLADEARNAAAADDGVKVYTHTKQGTVHEFTGSGANGRALLTADVEAGDTFTVNGASVSAWMGTEEAARTMAGSPWSGRWVTFVFDGAALNFKSGDGLTAADKAKLIPENIREGVTIAKVTGELPNVVCAIVSVQAHGGYYTRSRVDSVSCDPSTNSKASGVTYSEGSTITLSGVFNENMTVRAIYVPHTEAGTVTIQIDGQTVSDGAVLEVTGSSDIVVRWNLGTQQTSMQTMLLSRIQ